MYDIFLFKLFLNKSSKFFEIFLEKLHLYQGNQEREGGRCRHPATSVTPAATAPAAVATTVAVHTGSPPALAAATAAAESLGINNSHRHQLPPPKKKSPSIYALVQWRSRYLDGSMSMRGSEKKKIAEHMCACAITVPLSQQASMHDIAQKIYTSLQEEIAVQVFRHYEENGTQISYAVSFSIDSFGSLTPKLFIEELTA